MWLDFFVEGRVDLGVFRRWKAVGVWEMVWVGWRLGSFILEEIERCILG